MARRRYRRPWHRTRAYRLTRTIVVTVALLVCGVCVDRSGEPGRADTALPPGSAEAAAVVPGDSGVATAAVPGDSDVPTAAVPGGTDDAPAARPRSSRAPGPHTGPSRAPASPTAAGPTPASDAPGSHTAGRRPLGSDAPAPHASGLPPLGSPTPGPSTDAPGARNQRPAAEPGPNRTSTPTARPPRPTASLRPLPPSRATRLLIPYLRIDAPVMGLGLDRERRLTAPPEDDPKLVGWYRNGASPGERGTAVAVGHLDTDSGPAVFAGLPELTRGRIVKARRADGRIAVYTVDKIKSYEKAHFPSQEVYGARGRPELRLITCGGSYDRRKGYSGNVVVFAHLTGIQ
ncbi:class F sortase [Streptomyces afghaniensis]|uniref:class F sortase n=1 Tax=Streptomyces afghaniensis TaxID=66865 RepID=UPI0033A79326